MLTNSMFTPITITTLALAAFTFAATPEPAPAPAEPAKSGPLAALEPEPPAARAILINRRERSAQLQIFLDQQLFSPGMIDGKAAKFAVMALRRWQRAHSLPETGVVNENVPLDTVYPVYTFHTVAKEEFKWIGDLPGKPVEMAKKKMLPYANYTELLAERYHCSVEFLQRLNKGVKLDAIKAGGQLRVPNVVPFKIEEVPDTGNFPEQPEIKSRHIVINRKDTILELYEGDALIASVPIAPGSPAHPTPPGKWRILGVAAMPTFRWDEGVLNRGVRTKNFYMLPSGPNNPVGVGWIALNKPGIGIHGTNNPYSIGTWASHGCMRTANWDIARLSKMVTSGMQVEIK